mgnify:FL=1
MSKSSNYWRKREREWKKADLKDEAEYIQEIQDIYSAMLTQVNKEIESFFFRYSTKEGMSMAEAKRKASDIDIKEYEKKAKKYVKEKDFSKEANEQMRLYNLAMKVNRLELLKANIGLELTAGSDELVSFTKEKLEGAALEQIQRNAGILGDTIVDNAKTAKTIANSSFKNATFSERIWSQQDLLKNDLYGILSTALIQGRNPREFIPKVRKSFDVTRYQAERLLRTELTRVRIQAQAESYEANGIDEYEYVACGLKDVCPLCKELDKQIFKLKDMEIGENAPPRHPNCHCALAPHSDRKEYEKWLNGLANGDHDLRFDEYKQLEYSRGLAIRKGNIYNIATKGSSNVSLDTTKLIDSTIHNLFKEMPELKGKINEIAFDDLGNDIARASINKKFQMKLKLNTRYFENETILNEVLKNTPDTLSPKDGLYGYLKHEYAHFLEYQHCIRKENDKEEAWQAIKSGKYADEILKEALEYCNLHYTSDIIELKISYLATINSSEAIAEAYSCYIDNQLTKTIKKLVKKKWR